ncbi:hypothetical protein Bbelb_185010 [Branchiostoma belcheri]|nr:hypothetical protein Bbelb_185010 [Branchiostoma belcheri]
MPTAMFFPLLFLLACAAEGHVLARDTRTTTTTPTFWTTTTQQLPCWAYLKFTCPDLNCQGHAFVPHDYDNCRCGYCICPTDPSSGTTSRPWSCPTTVYTTVPTTTPTITTAYLTTPTTTAPTTLATTHPLPCWLQSWRFTCPYNKPCVDPTPDDYSNCRCGQCPNGPNCYAWDGSIIPAGGAVEVDGHACQCPDYDPRNDDSLLANCYNNEGRPPCFTSDFTPVPAGGAVEVSPFIFCHCPDDGSPGSLAVCEVDWSSLLATG